MLHQVCGLNDVKLQAIGGGRECAASGDARETGTVQDSSLAYAHREDYAIEVLSPGKPPARKTHKRSLHGRPIEASYGGLWPAPSGRSVICLGTGREDRPLRFSRQSARARCHRSKPRRMPGRTWSSGGQGLRFAGRIRRAIGAGCWCWGVSEFC